MPNLDWPVNMFGLTVVCNNIPAMYDWKVHQEGTLGRGCYPILWKVNATASLTKDDRGREWVFRKANWENVQIESKSEKQNETLKQTVMITI